jgi:predicted heme/steroid binding protein
MLEWGVCLPKYGKPVWQYVFEAAKEIGGTFTAVDIIHKVHEKNSSIPDVTIRSNVIAMAPNHPFSGHWPSTRRLHGVFKHLGEGRFTLLEKDAKEVAAPDTHATSLGKLKTFTAEELEEYDGKNGKPAYVAYQGKVYDFSQSGRWVMGNHVGRHQAGTEITEELEFAPHGDEVLERKNIKHVGKLI